MSENLSAYQWLLWGGLILCLLTLGLVFLCIRRLLIEGYRRRLWRRLYFIFRPNLSPDAIYDERFAGTNVTRESFIPLWMIAAENLDISPGRLRPKDRFDRELNFSRTGRDPHCEKLKRVLNEMAHEYNLDVDIRQIETLEQYVTVFQSVRICPFDNSRTDAEHEIRIQHSMQESI